jgi:hypothetical protein
VKRSPMRKRKPTPRKREAYRLDPDGWEELTIRLLGRDGTRCAWCGLDLKGDADRHHRQRRRDGGDTVQNLVLLHHACHMDAHLHVGRARADGLIVPTWVAPEDAPVRMPGVGWCMLTVEGTRATCQPPEGTPR